MVEKIQKMIDSLKHYPPEKQIMFLEDYKLEWLGDVTEECLDLIDQRLIELGLKEGGM